MTRPALLKIIGALAAIAICIGACCTYDAIFERAKVNPDPAASATPSEPNSNLEAVKELINGEAIEATKAANIFDLSIETTLPEGFAQEALGAEAFEEAYISDSTISFSFAGSRMDAATYCTETLTAKRWCALNENNDTTASFAKADGIYRWLVLQYLSVGNKTIVLVNIIDPKESS